MSYAPILNALGFSADERVVVFNADDFGLCESSISALDDLADIGIVSSASVMVPCPWFPAAAEWSRQHPEFSIGVHLTLTSEWNNYRWPSITPPFDGSGLLDSQGYLHQSRDSMVNEANEHAVSLEMIAQVERATQFGIDITHIDSHMYTALRQPFFKHYYALQKRFCTPVVLWPLRDRPSIGIDEDELNQTTSWLKQQSPAYLLDQHLWTRMAPPAATIDTVKKMLSNLKPGLSRFYIHPAKDSPELRRIVPDWQCRVADYDVFMSTELLQYIKRLGIKMVSYRQLKHAMQNTIT